MKTILFLIFTFVSQLIMAQSSVVIDYKTHPYMICFDLQQERFKAMIDEDTATLNRLIHKDLKYVHSNGLIESKSSLINNIITKKIDYNDFSIYKFEIQQADSIVILSGVCHVNVKVDNQLKSINLYFTSIYEKNKQGIYVFKFWQSTKLPD